MRSSHESVPRVLANFGIGTLATKSCYISCRTPEECHDDDDDGQGDGPLRALGAVEDLPLSVERDILRRRRVRGIMATEPDVIEPDATLREAAEMLLESKVGCLPVVEGLRPVGIITEADFVRDFLERG